MEFAFRSRPDSDRDGIIPLGVENLNGHFMLINIFFL